MPIARNSEDYNFTQVRYLARKHGSERMVFDKMHCDVCRRELNEPEMYYLIQHAVGHGVYEETCECVDCAAMEFCS